MITVGNKNIVDIIYQGKTIGRAYKGDRLVYEKSIPAPKGIAEYVIYNTPLSADAIFVSGEPGINGTPKTNIISWIRANSHRYVGTFNSDGVMVLKQLDDNNGTKYLDGSDASVDITSYEKDVWMKLPTFWYAFEPNYKGDTNQTALRFSGKEPVVSSSDSYVWHKWDGDLLVGVYQAGAVRTGSDKTSTFHSKSGETVFTNNAVFYSDYASNRGEGFRCADWRFHTIMILLGFCYYGIANINSKTGEAQLSTSDSRPATGSTNSLGMKDTTTTGEFINFWGLENWWGDSYISEYVSGIYTYDATISGYVYTTLVVNINGNTNDSYRCTFQEAIVGSVNVWIKTMGFLLLSGINGNTEEKVVPMIFPTAAETVTKGRWGAGYTSANGGNSSNYILSRGPSSILSNRQGPHGLKLIRMNNGSSALASSISMRLMYTGPITIKN